jgi:hypothetical protein
MSIFTKTYNDMKKFITILTVCLAAVLLYGCKGASDKPKFEGIADIGKVSTPGVMEYDAANDVYTVSAAGVNLWFATDAASIVWMKVNGDFEISGDIDFVGEGVNPHRKLGFMIREDLTDNCAYADIAVHGDGLTSLQYRKARGEDTFETGSEQGKAPTTIYLARRGNAITARSGKGTLPDYDEAAVDLNLPEECYVGLFLCSHEEDVVETGHFRNVTFKQ